MKDGGPRTSVVIQLLDEICRMEDTVLYFQNRILKKRVAVAELLNGLDCSLPSDEDPVCQVKTQPSPLVVSPQKESKLALRKRVDEYLSGLNGMPFWYPDAVNFVKQSEPAADVRLIKKCVYPAVSYALKTGKIKRCPGGFQKA